MEKKPKRVPGGLNEKGQVDEHTQAINVRGLLPVLEGTNLFGGKNPNGLYVPMSNDEQEVLHRLQESQDVQLVVHGWGVIDNPKMTIGDHRVGIDFRIFFKGLLVAQPLHFLDLELRTGSGKSLFRERLSVGPKPIQIHEGQYLDFMWDIAIKHMDSHFVKEIKPGAFGLTSLRQDRDSGEMSVEGNMKLNEKQKAILKELERNQEMVRQLDTTDAVAASKKFGVKVIKKDGQYLSTPIKPR